MCVLLDANAGDTAFGRTLTPAGTQLRNWLDSLGGRLVIGGKLTTELERSRAFREWAKQAVARNRLRCIGDRAVDEKTEELAKSWRGRSDDQHVIALAVVSGARILYSDDEDLRADFRNRKLVPGAPGKLFPRGEGRARNQARAKLLNQPDLCPSPKGRKPT